MTQHVCLFLLFLLTQRDIDQLTSEYPLLLLQIIIMSGGKCNAIHNFPGGLKQA